MIGELEIAFVGMPAGSPTLILKGIPLRRYAQENSDVIAVEGSCLPSLAVLFLPLFQIEIGAGYSESSDWRLGTISGMKPATQIILGKAFCSEIALLGMAVFSSPTLCRDIQADGPFP